MSEKGGDKPNVASLYWATDLFPIGFGRVEPAGSKKLSGYDPGAPPGTPGEVPTGTDHNWLFGLAADIARWAAAAHVREFEDLSEAIAATAAADVFRIGEPTTGNRVFGAQVYSRVPAGAAQINDACSDSERAYYLDTGYGIEAVNVDDGVQVWGTAPANISDLAIAAAGGNVFVSGTVGFPGVVSVNRDTGATIGRDAAAVHYTFQDLAVNGPWIVAGGPSSSPNDVLLYDNAFSPPQELPGSVRSHSDTVDAVAMDAVKFYFGGGGGASSHDVRAYTLVPAPVLAWETLLPTSGAPVQVNDIQVDGDLVYVATDLATLTAGGSANLFVLTALSGLLVSALDVSGTGDNATNVAIDDGFIYVTVDNSVGVIGLKPSVKSPGDHGYLYRDLTSIAVCHDADGVGVIATDGTTAIERYHTMDQPVTFQRTLGADENRHPFHKLATPIR